MEMNCCFPWPSSPSSRCRGTIHDFHQGALAFCSAGFQPAFFRAGGRCRGTDGKSPLSEGLQSLRAKRSISHDHQKSPGLSPISPDFPISEGSLLASPLLHSYVGAGFSPSPLFRSAFRSTGLRALSGPRENEKGLFRGNGEQFYAAGSACCAGIPCIRGWRRVEGQCSAARLHIRLPFASW